MMIRLRDLCACFEGVIPSIIATVSSDRIPNVSYLSHVALVDDEHVALSNQFFSKTAANVRLNANAALILVDPRDGLQYQLAVTYDRSLDRGALFEEMAVQLRASSAQIGMDHVMRLRGVDIYRVRSIDAIPSPSEAMVRSPSTGTSHLAAASAVARSVSEESEIGGIVDALLDGLREGFGCDAVMLLMKDPASDRLVAVGSRGYPSTGIGSEVAMGEALIGTAAAERRPVRISDMSRIRRYGSAARGPSAEEDRTRTIALPGMPEAMSQVALPMIAQGALRGVLFLESTERLAFTKEIEASLSIIAAHGAAALALAENEESDEQSAVTPVDVSRPMTGHPVNVVHHAYDDSVFIDNEYLIKGVPGRLLVHLLGLHLREGRVEFTNREIRLSDNLRLPDFKDNLETRLLLLRRRLEEKDAPIRLVQTGRGRFRLELARPALLGTVGTKGASE